MCQDVMVHSDALVNEVANFLVHAEQEFRVSHHVDEALNVGHCDILHTANIELKQLLSLFNVLGCDIGDLSEAKKPCHPHSFPVVPQVLKEVWIGPSADEIAQTLVLARAKDHFHIGVELTRSKQLLWGGRKERGGCERRVWDSLEGESGSF